MSRVSDPRLFDPDPPMAMIIDLLCATRTLVDLDFMFPELSHVEGSTWRIQVDPHRALRFEFVDGLGAFNIRLE